MNPGLWLSSSLFQIHSTASIGRGPLHSAPLKAVSTPSQVDVSLVNNPEGSVILGFSEMTILQEQIKTHLLIYMSV